MESVQPTPISDPGELQSTKTGRPIPRGQPFIIDEKNVIKRLGAQQARIVLGAPLKYRGLAVKAAFGLVSPRQAIRAQCQQCVGWSGLPDEVANCTGRGCALWSYRPYQTEEKTDDDLDADETDDQPTADQ